MAYISERNLQIVRNLIMDNDVEMCGNLLRPFEQEKYGLESKEDGLVPFIESVGGESSCQNKTYTKYTWHTHSKSSKGYPSVADIFIPLRKYPDTSLIFTIWGIWEFNTGQKYDLSEEKREFLKVNYIEKVLTKIYEHTGRGRSYPLSDREHSAVVQLTDTLNKLMQQTLNFKFVAAFTDWRSIKGDYKLRFG